MRKVRALVAIAPLALIAGMLMQEANRNNRENTKMTEAVSRFVIPGAEENGNKSLFLEIDKKFFLTSQTPTGDLHLLKVNYRNLTPPPGEMSVAGDAVVVRVTVQRQDFLSSIMRSKADGNWLDPMYGNAYYPDGGETKFGLSYRPQRVSGRPENLWQRIYSKPETDRYDFLIKCIPPISLNSISEPKTCGMSFNLPISADLSKSISILVDVDFDINRLSDWRSIEKSMTSFIGSRIVSSATITKRGGDGWELGV